MECPFIFKTIKLDVLNLIGSLFFKILSQLVAAIRQHGIFSTKYRKAFFGYSELNNAYLKWGILTSSFAEISDSSLPLNPLWPGTHISVTRFICSTFLLRYEGYLLLNNNHNVPLFVKWYQVDHKTLAYEHVISTINSVGTNRKFC